MTHEGQLAFPEMTAQLVDESKIGKRLTGEQTTTNSGDKPVRAADKAQETSDPPTTGVSPREGDHHSRGTKPRSQPHNTTASADRPLYYLTNRLNLNGILSSRIVGPREAYQKYYADLLERCRGWVPLLTTPPADDLLEAVTADRGSGPPVIIEFPTDLPGIVEVSERSFVFAPAVVLSHAVAIHFRDERAVRQHNARSYGNVHSHHDLIRVSPELFAGSVEKSAPIHELAHAHPVDWRQIDRIRGAVSATLAAARNGEQLAMAAASLGAARVTKDVDIPAWLSWSELNDLASHSSNELVAVGPGHPDLLAFRAAYEILGASDAAKSWSPREVVDALMVVIDRVNADASEVDIIARNLHRVREIVNVERDFRPFRSTSSGLTSAKALLLMLLRPDLGELLSWPEQETGADDAIRVTSAVFAGRLRGVARENVELRSLLLDDATAEWAVRIACGEESGLGAVEFVASADKTELRLDGKILSECPPLLADPVPLYRAVDDRHKESVRLRIAHEMAWPTCKTVRVKGDATVVQTEMGVVVTTNDDVEIAETVDETTFLKHLAASFGAQRQSVLDTLRGAS